MTDKLDTTQPLSGRISDEELDDARFRVTQGGDLTGGIAEDICDELQQSRALVSQLRALAERMRDYDEGHKPLANEYEAGKQHATEAWLDDIDSLLSAHEAKA